MEVDQNVQREAFGVVERYFAALNESDAKGVTDTFNFPHFRIGSAGNVTYYPDRSANHLENFRGRTRADGWHHSTIDRMEAIFTMPTKAHVNVYFRRLREDGSEIGSYFSLYVVTQVEGHWGLQGGSGNGS